MATPEKNNPRRPSKDNPIPLFSAVGSPLLTSGAAPVPGRSLTQDAWRRLKRNRLAMLGLVVICTMFVLTVLGPPVIAKLTGFDYTYQSSDQSLPPFRDAYGSWAKLHPMGTDNSGRDLLSRVLIGGRISLLVGIIATVVSLVIGVAYGATAGYLGGRIDSAMMRAVDVLYALPYMLIVIVLLAFFGSGQLIGSIAGSSATGQLLLLFVALGAVSWLNMARIVRGQVLSLKNQDFVMAARSLGVSPARIIFRHLVPNVLGPIIVYATLTVPAVMLQEAFLSFLGLGVQAPLASWGSLAADGINNIAIYPWQLIFPGVTMALTLFSLNFLGDGLRDALDPQTRRS